MKVDYHKRWKALAGEKYALETRYHDDEIEEDEFYRKIEAIDR